MSTPGEESHTYVCALCGGTYTKVWTDAEAIKEGEEKYPGVPLEEMAVVCDPCYLLITKETRDD